MHTPDAFKIDLAANTVCCPAGQLVPLRRSKDGGGHPSLGAFCNDCPQKPNCATNTEGRSVNVHAKHEVLDRARKRQRDPAWRRKYRATRPTVERRLAHRAARRYDVLSRSRSHAATVSGAASGSEFGRIRIRIRSRFRFRSRKPRRRAGAASARTKRTSQAGKRPQVRSEAFVCPATTARPVDGARAGPRRSRSAQR
jgi:hypothetical protein